jgi:hypothetical protein
MRRRIPESIPDTTEFPERTHLQATRVRLVAEVKPDEVAFEKFVYLAIAGRCCNSFVVISDKGIAAEVSYPLARSYSQHCHSLQ